MRRSERGSVTVELLLLTPVIVLIGLFALQMGRWSGAQIDVQHAADSAARAASMVSSTRMVSEARSVVIADLLNRGAHCSNPSVSVTRNLSEPVRVVRVTVACWVNRAGALSLGMPRKKVTAESLEYIDVFTYR